MKIEDFVDRVIDGEMKPTDVLILAVIILLAIAILVGEVVCIIWFFGIWIFALTEGASKLLMLIPCLVLISVFTSIIVFVKQKLWL